MLSMLKRFYSKVRFMALDKRKRPFVFAYSMLVDERVEKKSKEVGFDCCINSRLGPNELHEVIHTYIDTFA
jgi:hypothetical protein